MKSIERLMNRYCNIPRSNNPRRIRSYPVESASPTESHGSLDNLITNGSDKVSVGFYRISSRFLQEPIGFQHRGVKYYINNEILKT